MLWFVILGIMRVVFQSIQLRTNYHLLVSSAESGMYRYTGNWCFEPKKGTVWYRFYGMLSTGAQP